MPPNFARFKERTKEQNASRIDSLWEEIAEAGLTRFLAGLHDDRPESERAVADGHARKVFDGVAADRRMKKAAEGPAIAALIMMQPRLDSSAEWEAFAEAERVQSEQERRHIDAIPAQVVQREPRDASVPGELGSDLPTEGSAR